MPERSSWRPSSGAETASVRADLLSRVRSQFATQSVLEVDTPALSEFAVSDPHIESVSAKLQLRSQREYFLHTSPEYCMKRLLCDGYPDIYQVCKVFRDGESGRRHQPEFTMIEWYRLGFDLDNIIDNTLEIAHAALNQLPTLANRLSYRDAFLSFARLDSDTCTVDEISTALGADNDLHTSIGSDRDAWLNLALDQLVVPHFSKDLFTVLYHYPISQAALSRPCPSDPAVADRFELFLGDKELANGYVELTSHDEQARRFDSDQAYRTAHDLRTRPLDSEFLEAINNGLPACAGVAMGLDRLLMIAMGQDDIRNVQTFAFGEGQ